jgi:hypothetical protein
MQFGPEWGPAFALYVLFPVAFVTCGALDLVMLPVTLPLEEPFLLTHWMLTPSKKSHDSGDANPYPY